MLSDINFSIIRIERRRKSKSEKQKTKMSKGGLNVMKKRILSLVLAVFMLFGAMPLCASADNAGTQINEISFEFDLKGV